MKKKFIVERVIDSESVYSTVVEALCEEEAQKIAEDLEEQLPWELESIREYDHRVFITQEEASCHG